MPVKISKEDVEQIGKEISEFEGLLPGVSYGEDFSAVALTLLGTKPLQELVMRAGMIGLLIAVTLQPRQPEEAKDRMEKLFYDSPIKDGLVHAIYFGYRLGKSESQAVNS